MITFKKGFYITYNVGTYSIKDNGNGGKYIVSNEYSSVFNKEPKIQTRMDVINQRLARIQPILDYDSKTKVFTATWDWSSQLDGIMIELLLNLAEKSIVKKCANPTCDNYFTPLRDNRKYCCSTCAVCVAKRRQRQRAKEKAKEAKNDT